MPFVEDPAHLSKSRLKSDLVAQNVALPPASSKKQVYVELHLKHIDQKNAADFSSDEEDRVGDVTDKKKDPEDAEMPVPSSLTDDDLKATLLKHGVKAGPIVASTRALYERKLQKLLESDRRERLNETEKAVLYSDSEEEGNKEENDELGSEKQETADRSDKTQRESSQRPCPPRNTEPSFNWNSWNALKSSERSQSHCSQISTASSADHHTGLGSRVLPGSKSVMSNGGSSFSSQAFSITQMVEEMENRSSLSTITEFSESNVQEHWSQSSRLSQEPLKDTFKDIVPENKTTPTGIYVTCRRPIKGAAQRPVQYAYPDASPLSPMTRQRREVERHLVPIHIQILVFLILACVLYLIYVNVEDSLNYWSDSKERLLLQAKTEDTEVVSG